jgi:hypothetical protein
LGDINGLDIVVGAESSGTSSILMSRTDGSHSGASSVVEGLLSASVSSALAKKGMMAAPIASSAEKISL